MSDSTANFEDHFWGGGLKGFDVLMQNLKNGINASKEMMEFMKERSSIEDAYSKSIHRLNKTLSQVPEANLGAFHPVWMVLVEALDGLGKVHSGYSETFDALHKEISDYHHTQKERLKKNTKGVIDSARDYYLMFEMLEGTVHKSKKQYEHCAAEVAALTCDIQTAPPRVKEKLEEKLKKAEVKLKDSCSEHKDAVAQHCNKVMDVQGKMREAFQKFQSLEEDHISQLLLFVIKYTSTVDYMHQQSQEAHSSMSAKMNTLPNDVLISQFAIKKGTGADKPRPILFKEISVADLVKAHNQEGVQGEGRVRSLKLFSRRTKRASTDSHQSMSTSVTSPRDFNLPNSKEPEIDEEGYSIRPVDADRITGFHQEAQSSSDSDSDEDNRKKFRSLTIKSRDHVKTATDEELKSIKLQGPGGPGASLKLGSSTSLDVLERRGGRDSKDGSLTPSSSKHETASVDILDLDFASTKPATSDKQPAKFDLLGELPSPISKTLGPSLPFSTSFGSNSSSNSGTNPELGSEIMITGPKIQIDSVPDKKPSPAPRKKKDVKEEDPQGAVEGSRNNSFATQFKDLELKDEKRSSGSGVGTSNPLVKPLPSSGSNSPVIALPRPPAGGGRRRGRPSDSPLISLKSPTPPLTEPSTAVQDSPDPGKKISPSNTSQSITSDGLETMQSNQTTPSVTTSNSDPQPSTSSTPKKSTDQKSSTSEPVPLALAFIETANVIFQGSDIDKSMVKVSGELAVSFPSAYIGQLLIHEEFRFVLLGDLSRLRNVLHNTQFVLKESKDSAEYKFDMEKLFMNLSQKSADSPKAAFHNLLVLKYEVSVPPRSFPVQFSCQWMRGSAEDKATIKYHYISEGAQSSTPHPPLQGVVLTLPVDGVVEKVSSNPTGVWSAEHKRMVWKIPSLPVGEKGCVEVTFHHQSEVELKPSNPQIQFTSDTLTMSGLDLKIPSSAYKISLLKKKVSSGRYETDITHTQL
jgi:hypothetical protein